LLKNAFQNLMNIFNQISSFNRIDHSSQLLNIDIA